MIKSGRKNREVASGSSDKEDTRLNESAVILQHHDSIVSSSSSGGGGGGTSSSDRHRKKQSHSSHRHQSTSATFSCDDRGSSRTNSTRTESSLESLQENPQKTRTSSSSTTQKDEHSGRSYRRQSSLRYLDDIQPSTDVSSSQLDEFTVHSHLSPKSRDVIEDGIRARSKSPSKRRSSHGSPLKDTTPTATSNNIKSNTKNNRKAFRKSLSVRDVGETNWHDAKDSNNPSSSGNNNKSSTVHRRKALKEAGKGFGSSCPNFEIHFDPMDAIAALKGDHSARSNATDRFLQTVTTINEEQSSMTSSPTGVQDFPEMPFQPTSKVVEQTNSALQSWIDQTTEVPALPSVAQSTSTGDKTQKISNITANADGLLSSSSTHTSNTATTEMTDAAVYDGSRVVGRSPRRGRRNGSSSHNGNNVTSRIENCTITVDREKRSLERWSSGLDNDQSSSSLQLHHQQAPPTMPSRRESRQKGPPKPIRKESIDHRSSGTASKREHLNQNTNTANQSSHGSEASSHHSRSSNYKERQHRRSDRDQEGKIDPAKSAERRASRSREVSKKPTDVAKDQLSSHRDTYDRPPRSPPRPARKELTPKQRSPSVTGSPSSSASSSPTKRKKVLTINMTGNVEHVESSFSATSPPPPPPPPVETPTRSPSERKRHSKRSSHSVRRPSIFVPGDDPKRSHTNEESNQVDEKPRRRTASLDRKSSPVFTPSFFTSTTSHHRRSMTSNRHLTWTREKEENYSDWVILVVSGWSESDTAETYHVHRSVVGLGPRASQKLADDFEDYAVQSSSSRNVTVMDLQSAAADVFDVLLDYVYGKPLIISTPTATALRFLADVMGVETMFSEVNEFIKRDMNSSTAEIYLRDATTFDDEHLIEAAKRIL